MNAARRQEIIEIIEQLQSIKTDIEAAKDALDSVADEEKEAFDNMPEGPQSSYRGQRMEEGIEAMQTASSDLEDIDIDAIIEALEEVMT